MMVEGGGGGYVGEAAGDQREGMSRTSPGLKLVIVRYISVPI